MKLFGTNRYGVMAVSSVSLGSGLRSVNQTFDTSQLKMCHGLALLGHQNLLGHHETNHWSHRCDMKLFGTNRYGVMAVSSMSLGSGLRSENQTFDTSQLKMSHGLALLGHQKSFGTPRDQSLVS
jgi:hypothetical protein